MGKGTKGTKATKATKATTPETVEMSKERETEIRSRLAVLREEVSQLEGELARGQIHVLVTSTVTSPVYLVRKVFLSYMEDFSLAGVGRRKSVISKAVGAGVAPNTASTQYQYLRGLVAGKGPEDKVQALREEWESLQDKAGK